MAAFIVVLYGEQANPVRFDEYYLTKHIPLSMTIPGVKSATISNGPITALDGTFPFHQVFWFKFDSMEAAGAGMASPEGQAALADLANFVSGPVTAVTMEATEIKPNHHPK